MDGLNKKEKAFKEILQDGQIELDRSELWSAIADRLPQKRDRRPLIWFFSGLLMGALLILAFFYAQTFFGISEKTYSSSYQNPEVKQTTEFQPANHTVNNDRINDDANIERSASPGDILNSRSEAQTIDGHLTFAESKENMIRPYRILPLKALPDFSQAALKESPYTASLLSGISYEASKSIDTEGKLLSLLPIQTKTSFILASSQPMPLELQASLIEPAHKTNNTWMHYFHLRTGANTLITNYRASSAEQDALTQLSSRENPAIGMQADLRIEGSHNSGWGWIAGFSYATNAAVYREESFNIITETETLEVESIDDAGFRTVEELVVDRTVEELRNIQNYRVSKQLDLQAGLSRSLMTYKGFALSAEALVSYNLWSSERAYYFDLDNQTIRKFAESEAHPFRSERNWSIQFALNLGYYHENYYIGLSPYLRYRPGSIIDASSGYQLSQHHYGLQLSFAIRTFN
jgi:hypothetical protein